MRCSASKRVCLKSTNPQYGPTLKSMFLCGGHGMPPPPAPFSRHHWGKCSICVCIGLKKCHRMFEYSLVCLSIIVGLQQFVSVLFRRTSQFSPLVSLAGMPSLPTSLAVMECQSSSRPDAESLVNMSPSNLEADRHPR